MPKAYNLRSSRFGGSLTSTDLPPKFQGVKLGPLIGQGAYGRVYRGSIGEKAVSVKVLEIPVPEAQANTNGPSNDNTGNSGGEDIALKKALLEAVLSRHLAHPSVVPTLDYAISKEVRGNFFYSN